MTPHYELALGKYHSKLKTLSLPLISWDIFISQRAEITDYNSIQREWKSKESFHEIVGKQGREMIITNEKLEIIFATEGIFKMNGYRPFEVIGKSPKFFQGALTSAESRANIRQAVQNQRPFKEVILNYKKDGSTYLCEIEAFPKFNKKGELINYVAFERIAS